MLCDVIPRRLAPPPLGGRLCPFLGFICRVKRTGGQGGGGGGPPGVPWEQLGGLTPIPDRVMAFQRTAQCPGGHSIVRIVKYTVLSS